MNEQDARSAYVQQAQSINPAAANPSAKASLSSNYNYNSRPIVIIESPFAADNQQDLAANIQYAKECCLDAISLGEAPFASHLFFTQFLNDKKPTERELGITLAQNFYHLTSRVAVYADRGISPGMLEGIFYAQKHGIRVTFRRIRDAVDEAQSEMQSIE